MGKMGRDIRRGVEGAEQALVESVTWDDGAFEDGEMAVRIARQIAKNGFSYSGLSKSEATMLDEITMSFFCPEGLETILEFVYESPDGVHVSQVEELIARCRGGKTSLFSRLFSKAETAPQLKILPLFLTGRRLNGNGLPELANQYIVLNPDEVSVLHEEVTQAIATPAKWLGPGNEDAARKYLRDVLTQVKAKKAWLAARHC